MNRADKAKAEDFVRILRDVHTTIKKTVDAGNREATLALLEQCQSCAISIGEMIESSEGPGCATVSLMESYCELVYQIYEEVRQSPKVSGNRVHNLLAEKLIEIEKSIKKDLPVRREAVFLPYKASMWDSLESIWKAADEDPNCDAYVIPIPYYDKNPDGSFREMHYEADLYPDYVPITDYRNYDFRNRHPDMIFIHNPYDNYNYVTSVAPYFYSNNIKQFTDKLVYVPYFILGDIDPDNAEAVEWIAHFCTTPGVMNADKVIVQSENMRQAYINVLTKAVGEKTRKIWEEKILGLGSPKMDKVLATKREDLEVPEEWMKVIRKADGTLKKVILYNTSLNAFLLNTDRYLDKVRDVFRIFREEKEEVALLWRPHPLFHTTVKTMRPQFLEEYEKLVEDYRQEAWGIYDDSADLDRAIAVCDAYYGDPSSVVQLCEEAGRMVMIQDVEMLYDQEEESS